MKSIIPKQYAITATNGYSVGNTCPTKSETTCPTPDFAKIPPSAANICGKITAQPTACNSLLPSCTGVVIFDFVIRIAATNASNAPNANATSVTLSGSTRETFPHLIFPNVNVPIIVKIGIKSAGIKILFFNFSACFTRSCTGASFS